MKSPLLKVFVLGSVFTFASLAGVIPIVNGSFEMATDAFSNSCGVTCAYTTGVSIPGWAATGSGGFGQWIMGDYAGNAPTTQGSVLAYSNGPRLSQQVGTVVFGETYTLSVDLLHRNDAALAGSIEFILGGIELGAVTGPDPGPGNWGTFVATYTPTLADDGKTLTIALFSGGIQGDFDNVRLDATPEPGTLILFGSALTGLGLLRRRQS